MKMKHVATLLIALAGAIAAGTAFAGWSVIAVQDTPGPGWSSWGWTHNYAGQGEAINEAVRICSEGGGACRYLFFNEKNAFLTRKVAWVGGGTAGPTEVIGRACKTKPWKDARQAHRRTHVGCSSLLAEEVNALERFAWEWEASGRQWRRPLATDIMDFNAPRVRRGVQGYISGNGTSLDQRRHLVGVERLFGWRQRGQRQDCMITFVRATDAQIFGVVIGH